MFEQLMIACTGVTAVWLSQDHRENWRKYACLFGIIGQPFWFYSSFIAQQWGIFILCFFYTYSWIKGLRNHWWKHV